MGSVMKIMLSLLGQHPKWASTGCIKQGNALHLYSTGHSAITRSVASLQEKQRAEAAAKKLEAKKMAEEEAAQLASSSKKSSSKSAGTPKVHTFLHTMRSCYLEEREPLSSQYPHEISRSTI